MNEAELEKLIMKPTDRIQIGKYSVLGSIGSGGMGKIFLAFQPGPAGIEKLVVIKRLHEHLSSDPLLVENFLDEARLSMSITHPNVVHTYDVGEVDGRYFMAMEHIDGQSLGTFLRTSKRADKFPAASLSAGMFLSVLDGLHAAHIATDARGRPLNIVHRDVSPQNILVTYEGNLKVVDFGIAKAARRITKTEAGILKGKFSYMSPEQCEGKALDARSDVFSAGICLWEMLTGKRLYKSDQVVTSLERILNEPAPNPMAYNEECPTRIADVVLRSLAKNPDERFASAEDFKDALEDALLASGERFRRAALRDLMQDLFKDLRGRQRKMIEKVLRGDADDEDSVWEDDSASKVKIPDLKDAIFEAELPLETTGSRSLHSLKETTANRKSPGRTSTAARPPESEGSEPALPDVSEAGADQQTATLYVSSAGTEGSGDLRNFESDTLQNAPSTGDPFEGSGSHVTSSKFVDNVQHDTEADPGLFADTLSDEVKPKGKAAPSPNKEEPSRLRLAPLLALFVVLSCVGMAALFFGSRANDTGEPGSSAEPEPSVNLALDTKPQAPEIEPETAPLVDPAPAADAIPVADSPAGTDDMPAGDEAAADPGAGDDSAPSAPTDKDNPSKLASDSDDKSASTTPEQPTSKKADGARVRDKTKTKSPKRKRRFGFLTLSTTPWAEVFYAGKSLGNTPLTRAKLPTGNVTLVLKNPKLGIRKKYVVRILESKTIKKKLELK